MKNMIELAIVAFSLLVLLLFPPMGVLVAFLAVFIYLLIGKDRRANFDSVGFKPATNWWKAVLTCLTLGIVIEFGSEIFLTPMIETVTSTRIDLSAFDGLRGNIPNYVLWIALGWVVGGFLEEILFRGFLLTRISRLFKKESLGTLVAIAVTSASFGFSHLYQGWSGVLSTGSIAVVFGIIFVRSNRVLWYPILTHGFVNMTALTLLFFDYDRVLSSLIFETK